MEGMGKERCVAAGGGGGGGAAEAAEGEKRYNCSMFLAVVVSYILSTPSLSLDI